MCVFACERQSLRVAYIRAIWKISTIWSRRKLLKLKFNVVRRNLRAGMRGMTRILWSNEFSSQIKKEFCGFGAGSWQHFCGFFLDEIRNPYLNNTNTGSSSVKAQAMWWGNFFTQSEREREWMWKLIGQRREPNFMPEPSWWCLMVCVGAVSFAQCISFIRLRPNEKRRQHNLIIIE